MGENEEKSHHHSVISCAQIVRQFFNAIVIFNCRYPTFSVFFRIFLRFPCTLQFIFSGKKISNVLSLLEPLTQCFDSSILCSRVSVSISHLNYFTDFHTIFHMNFQISIEFKVIFLVSPINLSMTSVMLRSIVFRRIEISTSFSSGQNGRNG